MGQAKQRGTFEERARQAIAEGRDKSAARMPSVDIVGSVNADNVVDRGMRVLRGSRPLKPSVLAAVMGVLAASQAAAEIE